MRDNIEIRNQAEIFIHLSIGSDIAYQWSVENNDTLNMQIVLRAHGESFDTESAENQIKVAREMAA